ncbi:hypothetical protein FHQ08_11055 [Lactobacillus sp. CC-MHH1034]|uniref:hypothetical protein n=1 Tax=Agrilactobacillus fermenti TaxID=2586909 RepID=UPI001E4F7E08|nr:hypothetical protein [Agrilactobacillus fermenti]MCD2257255.1 hypothetical protein [Agrilactobacillus fermenti]
MSKRKRKRRTVNIGEYISANELRNYIDHADMSDLNFLETLIQQKRQLILAKEGSAEFPIFQKVEARLHEDETAMRLLIKQAETVRLPSDFEFTPSFLYGYFRDYPTDEFFEKYADWQKTIKKLHELQTKIGQILAIREQIRQSGFTITKMRYSQRSLSLYLFIPLTQASAFEVVFGRAFDVMNLTADLAVSTTKEAASFSVRISDHVSGQFFNSKSQQLQKYHQADVNIYI